MVSIAFRPRSSTRVKSAGLALEMKAQRQLVHVLEGEDRQPPHRVHRDFGEHAVAELRQQRHQDAHDAIGERHSDRRGKDPEQPRVGRNRCAALPGQRIDRPFEGERHRDGRELGAEQQHRRPHHAPLQVGAGPTARCRAKAAQPFATTPRRRRKRRASSCSRRILMWDHSWGPVGSSYRGFLAPKTSTVVRFPAREQSRLCMPISMPHEHH